MTDSEPTYMESSNFDEFAMQQSLWFSESLKDLKNLRTQLYSAAEYFELSYTTDDQKDTILETLKDYATKALVNAVDHLGSVTYKVHDLLDEKIDEVSGTEFNISCIEQRIKTCQEYVNHQGLSQQTLVINTPRYHKRYILPVSENLDGANRADSSYQGSSLDDEDDFYQFKNAVQAKVKDFPLSSVSKGRLPAQSPRPPQRTFSFTATMHKKNQEKRAVSPHRFPLLRTVSLSIKSNSQKPSKLMSFSRPTSPKVPVEQKRYPSEPRKSLSMRFPSEKEGGKDVEHQPSKPKRSLKSLLSRRKSKKDSTLYSYLDEY